MIFILVKAVLLIIVVGVLVLFLIAYRNPKTKVPVSLEITKGDGVRTIAQLLQDKHVINSKLPFYWLAWRGHKPLQSGIYLFTPNEPVKDIYTQISEGKVNEEKITFPEGWRREQIAQLLDKKKIVSYETFMAVSEGKEGTLFPDTYRIPLKTSAESIVNQMTSNYALRIKDINPTPQQLVVASLIEREAKQDADRGQVASVFYNRLAKGMKLESDVTVSYALDSDAIAQLTPATIGEYVFWKEPKAGQPKAEVSIYNTFKIAGLPPTPICNPGLKSIDAAIHPAKSDYLYFLADKDGVIHFAKTVQEHNANIAKYLNP